jgi:hypothetical protein
MLFRENVKKKSGRINITGLQVKICNLDPPLPASIIIPFVPKTGLT